jgi:CRP/FNR family transcriptional regulator
VTIRYLRPGDTVGSFVAVTSSYARSLEAIDPSELLHLDVARLDAVVRTEPVVAYELLVETSRAMRLAHRAYSLRAFGSIRVRVANAILERATARGEIKPGTVVQGTQHELAVAAGTVREVVATAVQRLKQEGIVDVKRGGLVIVDPAGLAAEAEGGGGFWPIVEPNGS